MDLLQLESIIMTQLMVRVPKMTEYRYPNMSFTNEPSDKQPSFPNVYVHELEPTEVGNDLENQRLHAIRETVQIEVTTNVSKAEVKRVAAACMYAMKALRFSIVSDLYVKNNNVHKIIIRARRIIANGDTF